jgi:trans-aconitate methyltransferase
MNCLAPSDFETAWNTELSSAITESILQSGLYYQYMDRNEYDKHLLCMLKGIDANTIQTGPHRIQEWEDGWSQNLNDITDEDLLSSIIPKYYGKYEVSRWKQSLIKPANRSFDAKVVKIITEWCFEQYISQVDAFYEFGCGPGHNLMTARHFNPTAEIWGCDWADSSQKIVNRIASITNDKKMFAQKFDFFNIDDSFILCPNSAIFTLASLEQTSTNYTDFVNYIIMSKPSICIHIEPIEELLNNNNLLDYLSISFFHKRNYLSGFLTFLRGLEKEGRIEILRSQRTYTGSFMIEGHSIIVWKPIYKRQQVKVSA